MKNNIRLGSTHAFIGVRLLISFGILLLARVLFILLNIGYFEASSSVAGVLWLIIAGIRYDLSSLMMINGLWIVLSALPFPFRKRNVYRWVIGVFYYVPNLFALTVNMIDLAFFRFTLRRTTGDVFNFLFHNDGMNLSLIPDFLISYWYLVLLWLVLLLFFVWLSRLFVSESKLTFHANKVFVLWNFPVFLVWIALVVIGIRGGFQLKPISLVNAASVVPAQQIPAILNTPFVMVKTIKNNRLPQKEYMTEQKASELFSPDQHIKTDSISGRFKGYNVMVIMMESFSLEYTSAGGGESFTPFLDSLASKGLFFKAHANGKRSIEAIPAVLASLPTWMDFDFISSPYAANSINSLASLLKPLGYNSLFFHGGSNGTMSFDAFCRLAGFDRYYGRNEYNNDADFDGKWGIWDELFFGYTASVLQNAKQPFVAGFFSLSSHHPYLVPQKYEGRFPKGRLPIEQAVAYADYSLGRFFKEASTREWFKKTIFVITADHTSESTGGYFQTRAGQYDIPLLFYCSSGLPHADSSITVQQTDIMPSLLYLLGFDQKFTAFGSNVFDLKAHHFAMNYADGSYQYFDGQHVIHFADDHSTALFDLSADSLQTTNLLKTMNHSVLLKEQHLKAIIQQYNARMNQNALVPR